MDTSNYKIGLNDVVKMKERLVGLDLLRIISALMVFLFHEQMHMGTDFGFFYCFIRMGAIFMTAFFMLSGCVLYHTYKANYMLELKTIKKFYMRRTLSIMPMYWSVAFVYDFFVVGVEYVKEAFLLIPIEVLGLQTVFNSLFSFGHNGGTWFVSCIIICYLAFPYLIEVIKQLSVRGKILITCGCIFLLEYAPFIVNKYGLSNIYSNPFFRILEFLVGMCLISLYLDLKDNIRFKWIFTVKCVVIEFIVLFVAVTICVKNNWYVDDYMMYNLIGIPCFGIMLWSLLGINCKPIEKSKVIKYLSNISYAFFLAQFFTWNTSKYILNKLDINSNISIIIITLLICIAFTIGFYEIDRMLRKMILLFVVKRKSN